MPETDGFTRAVRPRPLNVRVSLDSGHDADMPGGPSRAIRDRVRRSNYLSRQREINAVGERRADTRDCD
jgi:hypothetical protein